MSLGLEHLTTITVQLDDQHVMGHDAKWFPAGLARCRTSFEGGRLFGIVKPGGADWNLVLADGSTEFHARYTLATHDGVLIAVTNVGIDRRMMAKPFAGERPDMSEPMYATTVPRFEVGDGRYIWLAASIFVAELTLGRPGEAVLRVFEVT